MIQLLHELAEVRAGHPFRGRIPISVDGNVRVVQMRDISSEEHVFWPRVLHARIEDRKGSRQPDWLREGDVLFVARGGHPQAVCLRKVPSHAVCAQYFFLLRLKCSHLLPEYLAWHINRAPAQVYLRRMAEGSDQLSIRRTVLEALPVPLPDLKQQQQLVGLSHAIERERQTFEAITRNRKTLMDLLAQHLTTPHPK